MIQGGLALPRCDGFLPFERKGNHQREGGFDIFAKHTHAHVS